jgi:hypothetical protein
MLPFKSFVMPKSLLLLILSAMVVLSASAQSKQIDKLNFIYKKGFKMHFSGERIVYDAYNFPKSKSPSFLEYSVTDEKQKGKENVLRVQSSQNGEKKDTMTYGSYLYINDDGLFFWIWDEEKKIKEKTKTQPISLPLRTGKTWDSYYGKNPAKMECISTDSLIKTPLGAFKTFVVKVTFTDKSQKGFDTEITMVDFYNENIGQVELQMSSTAVFKKEDAVRKKIADTILMADKMTKGE